MAISLQSVQRVTQLPPRIVLYGVPGIGKTTAAALAPNPVFIPAEDGFGKIAEELGHDVMAFPKPTTFNDVIESITALIEEDHDYKTVVIDSADKVEPLIHEHVCAYVPNDKGTLVDRIEQFGYGKGFTHALNEWRMLTRGLDVLREQKGMAVIIIAHSMVAKVEAPDADVYDRYQMAIDKRADAWLCDWCDALLFANFDVTLVTKQGSKRKRAVGDGTRICYTQERPAFRAKNRYSMPEQVSFTWSNIAPFLFPTAAAK